MSKFKVGDTVRVVDNQYDQHSLGHVAKVTNIDDDGDVWIGNLCYSDSRIELVEESFDPIQKPNHYNNHPSGVQCIDITKHMGFNLGNVIKYVWRADLKGNAIEDLKKAQWYIENEIEKRESDK